MNTNFISILYIALILFSATNKVNGEADVVTNSNVTDSVIVTSNSTNVTESNKNVTELVSEGSVKVNKSEDIISTKKGVHGEECDPLNMCTDEQDEFVACLRVPGNDAPHLSLLIQNKGKSAVLVTITAPGFVKLEKDKVQLLQNEDTKVKVSVNKGRSNDSAILLTSSKGHCRLELKELAAEHETGKGDDSTVAVSRPSVFNIRPRTIIVIVMISFLVLSLVIIPVIIHIYRSRTQGKHKYQRLDMELPVSNNAVVAKSDHGSGDDGWNNNWGDDWDDGEGDEEQPNTPVLPLTPSLSARGLAPRRLSKEGWKD